MTELRSKWDRSNSCFRVSLSRGSLSSGSLSKGRISRFSRFSVAMVSSDAGLVVQINAEYSVFGDSQRRGLEGHASSRQTGPGLLARTS